MPKGTRFDPGHAWDLSPKAAVELQHRLAARVRLEAGPREASLIAGVDTGFEEEGRVARAAVVVMRYPALDVIETRIARAPVRLPYVPGLLSFRELPVVLEALEQVAELPDLILCDGQGIAHPRRLGIASHLGVVTDLPTIGVGKSRLVGRYREPDTEKGSAEPLTDGRERIGTVLRTRRGVRPVFVSPGHRTCHEDAVRWVLACVTRYRLPEPIRAADRMASGRRATAAAGQPGRG